MRAASLVLAIAGGLTVSCDKAPLQPAARLPSRPQATATNTASVVGKVDLIADAPPSTFVNKNACLSFHAKVWDRSDTPVYLPNQPVDWNAVGLPLTFDNATDQAPTQVTRNSSQAVLVCGKFDGFGSFWVLSDGVRGSPFTWFIDVGSPVQSLTVEGPTRMHDNQSSAQLDAWALDQWGTGKDLTTKAVWSSNNPAVVSLLQNAGQEWATQHQIGTATISATVYGKTAQLVIKVLGVASVEVTPPSATIHEATTTTLTATARDEEGGAFTGKTVSWTTSDAAVATVSSTGVVTGVHWGQATISASVGGFRGSATITVVADNVSGYYVTSVSGAPTPITAGGTYDLTPTTSTPGTPPVSYKWEVSYSNGVLPPQSTGFLPGTYHLQVPDGNYKITVTVTPRQLYGTGYPTNFIYPVCTGAAQPAPALAARAGVQPGAKRPGKEPNVHEQVVAGCNKPPPL